MAEQLKISNGTITAILSTKGAELKSIVKNNTEYLWGGNPDVWAGQAPVLFPVCGGLKDDTFVLDGKSYILEKHGYARFQEFRVVSENDNSVTFVLGSDDESLKKYPFSYNLYLTYTLIDNKIEIKYLVENTGETDMYYSIGAHEGYSCPEGIEEYKLVFEKKEDLTCNVLNGNLLEYNTYSVGEDTNELPLKYDYFSVDALTFLNLKSRKVSLVHTKSSKKLDVEFDGFDYMFVWTKPGANYICIEPWCGIPDFIDSDNDITNKRGIIRIAAGKTDVRVHNIVL